MFAKSRSIHLLDSESENYKIVWSEFDERLFSIYFQKLLLRFVFVVSF